MLIQNNTTWAKMPLGQKVTWAIVYLGKDTTWAMWSLGQKPTWAMLAGAIVAWAKKALGNRGLGKSGSTIPFSFHRISLQFPGFHLGKQ